MRLSLSNNELPGCGYSGGHQHRATVVVRGRADPSPLQLPAERDHVRVVVGAPTRQHRREHHGRDHVSTQDRLAALAEESEAPLFSRPHSAAGRYAGRLLCRALCPGAALHYLDGKTGGEGRRRAPGRGRCTSDAAPPRASERTRPSPGLRRGLDRWRGGLLDLGRLSAWGGQARAMDGGLRRELEPRYVDVGLLRARGATWAWQF